MKNSFLPSVDAAIAYAVTLNYDAFLSDFQQQFLLFKVSECASYDPPFALRVLATKHLSQTLSFKAWL